MADLPAQIGEIEAQIECLSEATHNCRKIAVAAQVAAAGGGLILISMSLGVLRFSPEGLVITIAAVFGGIALRGTNRSTLDEKARRRVPSRASWSMVGAAAPRRLQPLRTHN